MVWPSFWHQFLPPHVELVSSSEIDDQHYFSHSFGAASHLTSIS